MLKFWSGWLSVALLGMTVFAGAQVPRKQVPPDAQQQTVPQEPSKTAESEPPANVQTFRGTIINTEGGYVFKDSTGATYQLDDQKKAKDFSGQRVTVTGALDASSNMIRVTSIAPAS